ncbi:hypothetical protein [Azospirillum argentinense]|uniref:hypothetical protein n=1 Tax=Azospirillum argentinense TaxID=2970906 RepID=UPI0032DE8A65
MSVVIRFPLFGQTSILLISSNRDCGSQSVIADERKFNFRVSASTRGYSGRFHFFHFQRLSLPTTWIVCVGRSSGMLAQFAFDVFNVTRTVGPVNTHFDARLRRVGVLFRTHSGARNALLRRFRTPL